MTLSLYLALVATGLSMVYAVSFDGVSEFYDLSTRHGSQLLWTGISIIIGFTIIILDSKFYQTFANPIYLFIILCLIYVLVFGRIVAGSKSWVDFGFFRFQPSEFAKFATCLALASYLSGYKYTLQNIRAQLTALGIILLPMVLILLQGDAGSALVFTSLLIVLYREGMPLPIYILGGTVVGLSITALMFDDALPILLGLSLLASSIIVFSFKNIQNRIGFALAVVGIVLVFNYSETLRYVALGASGLIFLILFFIKMATKNRQLAIVLGIGLVLSSAYVFSVNYAFYKVLKPHQQDRVLVWLRPDKASVAASYNVTWSKRAIGSGGLTGKGFLQGNITKLDYVPAQETDFIFCTIGEEQGFVGSFSVIALYLLLLLRIVFIAERQRSKFTRIYGYGVASVLFFHFLINIGMTMGLMPVIGIPLPYLSYGGSSLLAFTILLAILLKMDSNRLLEFR